MDPVPSPEEILASEGEGVVDGISKGGGGGGGAGIAVGDVGFGEGVSVHGVGEGVVDLIIVGGGAVSGRGVVTIMQLEQAWFCVPLLAHGTVISCPGGQLHRVHVLFWLENPSPRHGEEMKLYGAHD
jgi:hypothetical protein